MSTQPWLRPTVLQQLRGFLAESGVSQPPWTSFDQVMDALLALLHDRRDDAAFFARLAPFLEELRSGAARGEAGLPARQAEILEQASLETLIADLRGALRAAPRGIATPALRAQLAARAAPLLCLTLLVTALTGCTDKPASDNDRSGVAAESPVAATVAAPTAAPVAAPVAAGLTTDAMVEMFKNQSPEQTARWLEQQMNRPDAGKVEAPYRTIRSFGDNSKVKYKGVSF